MRIQRNANENALGLDADELQAAHENYCINIIHNSIYRRNSIVFMSGLYELPAERFKVCRHCHMVSYCSEACQAAHWSAHKADCQPRRVRGGNG